MFWTTVFKIVTAIIFSFGGAGAIIVAIIKFCVDKIADRLEQKYELRLSQELETFKSKLESKSYVSKTRFDAEFDMYRQLSKASADMVKEVGQLFPRFTKDSRTDIETYKSKYDTAFDKVIVFQDLLTSNAPFISEDMYSAFHVLEEKCKEQLSDFVDFRLRPDADEYRAECKDDYKSVWKRTDEIQKELASIIQTLRKYLSTLEVL